MEKTGITGGLEGYGLNGNRLPVHLGGGFNMREESDEILSSMSARMSGKQ